MSFSGKTKSTKWDYLVACDKDGVTGYSYDTSNSRPYGQIES